VRAADAVQTASVSHRPAIRVRIVLQEGVALGPGKADLLGAIAELGSIAAAGRSMGMSYQRAWSLVDELNRYFREPVVEVSRGGVARGGARLTPVGREVLASYRAIEKKSAKCCGAEIERLRRLTPQDASRGSDPLGSAS
jgi:molybdate transport system regulatory protein